MISLRADAASTRGETPTTKGRRLKFSLVAVLAGGITLLHYFTQHGLIYHHIFYRELYFLPLILAGFWFGLRGGLLTSLGITALYLPYTLLNWNNFSPDDLDTLLEIILFNVVALMLGYLRDREKKRAREKLEGVMAMAGTVAHELNTPLQVALGNTQLLFEETPPETETATQLRVVIDNLQSMGSIIRKMSGIDRIELKEYTGGAKIIDLEKASP